MGKTLAERCWRGSPVAIDAVCYSGARSLSQVRGGRRCPFRKRRAEVGAALLQALQHPLLYASLLRDDDDVDQPILFDMAQSILLTHSRSRAFQIAHGLLSGEASRQSDAACHLVSVPSLYM